jgi:hypothetical protein
MTPTITDTTLGPYVVAAGGAVAAFVDVSISDPPIIFQGFPVGGTGTLSIHLTGDPDATVSTSQSDAQGTWDESTQTLTQYVGVARQLPNDLAIDTVLAGDVINVPTLAAGTSDTIDAWVSFLTAYDQVASPAPGGGLTGVTLPPTDTTDASPVVIDASGPAVTISTPTAAASPVSTNASIASASSVVAPVSTPAITQATVATMPPLLIAGDPMSDQAQVSRLYYATLDRGPDPTGLANWTNEMQSGVDITTIAAGFVNSPEFLADYGATSDISFVTMLYANVLDRAPDSSGLANWTNALNAGVLSRTQVVVGFSNSQEFINNLG